MLEKTLAYLMILMFSREAPGIMKNTPQMEARRQEITQLAKIHAEVAAPGHLVDPQTDAALLAAVSWFESRHMLKPRDGDARYNQAQQKLVGTVVGPMQVSKAAPQIVPTWSILGPKYKGLTVEKMRDPRKNVELAYDILRQWKDQCEGSPGVWITAYGWGRCPGKTFGPSERTVDWEGKRRCKLATQTMIRMEKAARTDPNFTYTVPKDWYCGHETGVTKASLSSKAPADPTEEWLLELALNFAPPARAHQFPGWEETVAERTARYREVVKDIREVVFDKKQRPIPGMSRSRTAAYMLALGIGESGLDPDADKGPCYRDKGWWRRCDAGQAASMWQVKIGKGFLFDRDQNRIWMKDLFADRKVALRIALRAVRGSFWACRKSEPKHRLAVYGSGSCSNKAGMVGSEKRYALATKLWGHTTIPKPAPTPPEAEEKPEPEKDPDRVVLQTVPGPVALKPATP